MKTDVYCGYCGKFLGRLHGTQATVAHTRHFRDEHSDEFREMKEASCILHGGVRLRR